MEEKHCLKCGRPCAADQAFCADCLADMEKHPVKPGVVVLLPPRTRTPKAVSRRRHTAPPLEEQVARLKRKMFTLCLVLALALSATGILGCMVLEDYLEEESTRLQPGQNYSAEETQPPEETN